MLQATSENVVNGIDVDALRTAIGEIEDDASKGLTEFRVVSRWTGGTTSETKVDGFKIGGEYVPRPFTFTFDEPCELLGTNKNPNPQEYLMGAMNACMLVGYACGCAVRGITIGQLSIETYGELDLRGFLGIDPNVKPGYDTVRFVVRIKGDGTAEQFRDIHETVMKTSPNYFNIGNPIKLVGKLLVDQG